MISMDQSPPMDLKSFIGSITSPFAKNVLIKLYQSSKITKVEDVLLISDKDVELCGYSAKSNLWKSDFEVTKTQAARIVFPSILSTLSNEMIHTPPRLSTGCPVLDACTKGGIPGKQLVEIVGEAGSGKTQLCLQLLIQCLLSVDGSTKNEAIFVSTEGNFPVKRWEQLLSSNSIPDSVNDRLHIVKTHTLDNFLSLITQQLEEQFRSKPVKLLVIDSIASFLRTEFDQHDHLIRSQTIFSIAQILKKLASEHNLYLICSNQVSDVIESEKANTTSSFLTGGRYVVPALGLSWSNCVDLRIALKKTFKRYRDIDSQTDTGLREMEILLSSYIPQNKADFIIEVYGIRGVYG